MWMDDDSQSGVATMEERKDDGLESVGINWMVEVRRAEEGKKQARSRMSPKLEARLLGDWDSGAVEVNGTAVLSLAWLFWIWIGLVSRPA